MDEFWDNKLPPSYYDENLLNGLNKNKGIQANWHNLTFEKIMMEMPKVGNHLDYACGPGSFIGNYLNLNSIGVDISKNQISFANSKYQDKGTFYEKRDFDFLDYKEYFDVITVIGLLEYLNEEEALELIENLYTTLKNNGKILFTTPNYGSLMKYLEKIMHHLGPIDYSSQNKSKYTYKKINAVFKKNNKGVISVYKFLNLGIIFSLLSINTGKRVVNFIDKLFFNKKGFLFLIKIEKI